MTLTKSIIFVAIFSNLNCIWQRGAHSAPIFQDLILLDIISQYAIDIIEEKSEPKEYKEKKEDPRVRLLRKRDFEALVGKISQKDIADKKSDPKEYKEKKADPRVRLLRKRDFESSVGKIRIL